ncbi:MAG: hypothetical protein AAF657_24090 [Acidobacteriota bacterium]
MTRKPLHFAAALLAAGLLLTLSVYALPAGDEADDASQSSETTTIYVDDARHRMVEEALANVPWDTIHNSLAIARSALEGVDTEAIHLKIDEAMAAVDFAEIEAEVAEALEGIDWEEVEREIAEARAEVEASNLEEIEAEVREAMEGIDWEEIRRAVEEATGGSLDVLDEVFKELAASEGTGVI